jgi:hypothetical protein
LAFTSAANACTSANPLRPLVGLFHIRMRTVLHPFSLKICNPSFETPAESEKVAPADLISGMKDKSAPLINSLTGIGLG